MLRNLEAYSVYNDWSLTFPSVQAHLLALVKTHGKFLFRFFRISRGQRYVMLQLVVNRTTRFFRAETTTTGCALKGLYDLSC